MRIQPASERLLAASSPLAVLTALAWGLATQGGTTALDLVLVCAALTAAFLTAAVNAHRLPTMPIGVSALVVALMTWVVIDGPLRSGLDVETARVPMLLLATLLTVGTVSLLSTAERTFLLRAFIGLGTVHALLAVAGAINDTASCMCAAPSRADSLLGNPNALGVVLVATGILTARELQRRGTPLLGAVLAVQAVALLLTGSRLALLTALGVIAWYWTTQATRIGRYAVVPWIIIAVVIVTVRFIAAIPDQRWYLWIAAAHRIAAHPVVGHGPTLEVYALPLARARSTTQAHNEILQWTADYGLIGLVLLVAVLVVAFRSIHHPAQHDCWLVMAAASVLVSGLTDFTLRITAVAVIAALLGAVALLPAREPFRASPGTMPSGRPDAMGAGTATSQGVAPRPLAGSTPESSATMEP